MWKTEILWGVKVVRVLYSRPPWRVLCMSLHVLLLPVFYSVSIIKKKDVLQTQAIMVQPCNNSSVNTRCDHSLGSTMLAQPLSFLGNEWLVGNACDFSSACSACQFFFSTWLKPKTMGTNVTLCGPWSFLWTKSWHGGPPCKDGLNLSLV